MTAPRSDAAFEDGTYEKSVTSAQGTTDTTDVGVDRLLCWFAGEKPPEEQPTEPVIPCVVLSVDDDGKLFVDGDEDFARGSWDMLGKPGDHRRVNIFLAFGHEVSGEEFDALSASARSS